MSWKIEEAQQQFPEIISAAGKTPQLIYQHNHLVAAVIRADLFQEFLAWQLKQQQVPIANAFAELHQLCLEENYTFESVARRDLAPIPLPKCWYEDCGISLLNPFDE